MKKILVCLPYWDGDKAQQEEVASLACDLLPEKTQRAEIAFVARFDSTAPSKEIQIKCATKFDKVRFWKCNRNAVGFPAGCNELAYGILGWVPITKHLHPGEMADIDVILIIEGDCVITRPNWVDELWEEWDKTERMSKLVCGARIPEGPYCNEHINAAAMYKWSLSNTLTCLRGGPQDNGWDNYHGPNIIPHAYGSPLFFLDYKKPTITPEELFTPRGGVVPLIYHGIKDDSGIKAVREKYSL